jgi:hypothetical protein
MSCPPSLRARGLAALGLAGAVAACPAAARLVPAEVVIAEGDPLAGSTVASLNSPFTNGDGRLAFTFGLAVGGAGVWHDGAVRWLNSDALPDVLIGGESTMGVGDAGELVYSPSFNGEDCAWGEGGLILAAGMPAPGFPAGTLATFNSRPRMVGDGTAYWVAGFNETGGTSTQGRVLYRSRGPGPPQVVLRSDDLVDGLPIGRPDGVTFDHHESGDGAFSIQVLVLDAGAAPVEVVRAGGAVVARQGEATGDGDAWESFDDVSVNAAGRFLFSGDTDGPAASDEIIAVDGTVGLREGDVVDGVALAAAATVQALSLNDLAQAVHLWRVAGGVEHLFFAADAADLRASVALLSTGDELDTDGDGLADHVVTDFTASGVVGPGLDLAEDGFVFVGADVEPSGGGVAREAILRLGLGQEPPSDRLYRSTVLDLSPGWQGRVPLPLTPSSAIDPGWPRDVDVPGSTVDAGVVQEGAPLVLYRLLDATGAPRGDSLRLARGPAAADLTISY